MDPARRGEKMVVARSECRFTCLDRATLDRCIEQIRISDEHLKNRPAERMLWDWQTTVVETDESSDFSAGATVILGVAWYDEDFFQQNHDAYTNRSHLLKYLNIGLLPGAVTVTHWKLVSEGKV